MSEALIDELIGRGAASRGQVEEAKRRMDASGGRLVERLVEVGCSADRILATWSASTGIPAAPRSALARPVVPVGLGVAAKKWLTLGAVPFGTDDEGNVLVAIMDPGDAPRLESMDLPDFVVHLAAPDELRAGLLRAFPELAGAAPATLPGGVQALPLDDQSSRLPGNEQPTTALPRLSKPRDELDLPVTAADNPLDDSVDKTVVRTLPREPDVPEVLDDGDFDGPTQALSAAELAPFTHGSATGDRLASMLPTQVGAAVPASRASAFDDDEPKTLAMTLDELRASLKARGVPSASGGPASAEARKGGEAAGPPLPESDALDDDDFGPKTVSMSLDEMRASLRAVGALAGGAATADDAARRGAETDEDASRPGVGSGKAATDEPADRSGEAPEADLTRAPGPSAGSFDYSAAADEFDDGEGREHVATSAKPARAKGGATSPPAEAHDDVGDDDVLFIDESTEAQRPRLSADVLPDDDEATRIAEPPPSPAGDDFDEKTIAADGLSLDSVSFAHAQIPAMKTSEATGADLDLPEHDPDDLLMLDGDDDGDGDGRSRERGESADEEQALAEARTRMQAALDEVESLAPPAQHGGVFTSSDDHEEEASEEEDEEATQAGVDPAGATRVSVSGYGSRLSDEISSVPTAAIPMLNKPPSRGEREAAPESVRPANKGIDTSPTGPIAVRGYDVKDILGAGGMATVYRAHQRSADREVALKILAPHLSNDAAFVARFQREIRSSASLTHPNIIRVFDYGDEDGVYYMATEVMDSGSLRDALHEYGPLPVPITVKLLEHLLLGIGHAHKRSMVHRDIKPANLMLSSEGLLKIGDFGIAKSETDENLTRTGALFGTPAYMSPEQALGRTVDFRSDLFACGIIGYELLTGENPYQSETASAALLKVSRADPPPLLLACQAAPPLLVDVIARLQRRDPSERPSSAEDAIQQLRPLLDAVDRRWPDLVTRYTSEPRATIDTVLREHAAAELERARHHLGQDPPLALAGAQAAYLATVLDADSRDARKVLAELSKEGNFNFGVSTDPRVHDAERALEEDPRAPGLLRRISDLYRAGGNPFKAALWLRQYLAVKPTDTHAEHQLSHLVGPSPLQGLDEWEAPAEKLEWSDSAAGTEDDGPLPEDTVVPPRTTQAPQAAGSEDLDLRPIGFVGGVREPAPAPRPDPVSAGVRPALALQDPSDVLKAAASRARGGLQVLKTDAPSPSPSSQNRAAPAGPSVQSPQPTFAVPRAPAKAPTTDPLPPAVKMAIAAAGGAVLLLLLISAAVFALSGDDVDVLVAQADPGDSASPAERQRQLTAFARARLAQGDGVRALQAAERAYALGSGSAEQGEALLLRGRAYAAVGHPEAAKKDFLDVMARFPEGNLLHLEAKQQLKELPK